MRAISARTTSECLRVIQQLLNVLPPAAGVLLHRRIDHLHVNDTTSPDDVAERALQIVGAHLVTVRGPDRRESQTEQLIRTRAHLDARRARLGRPVRAREGHRELKRHAIGVTVEIERSSVREDAFGEAELGGKEFVFPCACQTVDTALHTLKIARLHHVRDSRSGNPSAHNLRRRHQTAVRFRQVDDSLHAHHPFCPFTLNIFPY